ncbi:zinc finger CCHC domain-containing protein 7 isoform X1 [Esox lucius]|uniref:Zinc finger CCHC domain-containing protein 7 n=1 Tax=Esox lucius TaxID=8010 RepID=A0A3P8ZNW3_ESOLU|nr:zinc finger CCHC domain-containing protein 7 isoform X1 [Esox lucius]
MWRVMFGGYEERLALEDELYGEGEESGGSEVDDSELEFRLYSQLHYSSNPGDGVEEGQGLGEETCREKGGIEEEELQKSKAEQHLTLSHDLSGKDLRQHLVGDTEQKKLTSKKVRQKSQLNVKQQRDVSKGDPKVQRLFQEVIVIDLGSDDVITVSDNTEDDEGVCNLKCLNLPTGPAKTSTPVLQRNSAKVSASGISMDSDSVLVLDSDSESESESDSDGLESWMILGTGKQDGDQSISLNLEGSGEMQDGDSVGSWLISNKDKEAQIFNRRFIGPSPRGRVTNRYYTDKNVTCRSCKKTGHLSKNCPTPKKDPCCMLCGEPGHRIQSCPSRHCNRCGLPGHEYAACHGPNLRFKQCHRCGMHGHLNNTCPEIWRQYHITTKSGPLVTLPGNDAASNNLPYCYNCSHRGHFGFDCSQRRMFAGILPCSPFINHYDSPSDLRKLEVRTRHRVKELKDAGVFQSQLSPQSGARDEPPGKRQRPNPSPYSKRKHSDAPVRTHIRFTDGQEKPWTPKHKLKESGEGRHVTPAKSSPSENSQPRGQKGQKRNKQKQVQNKMASVSSAVDDCLAFPRGGAPHQKKGRKGPQSSAGAPLPFSTKGPPSHAPERLFGAEKKGLSKNKRRRANGRERKAKMTSEEMYPSDENLFLIKQRKPRR